MPTARAPRNGKHRSTMDVYGALRELYDEKRKLDATISALEAGLLKGGASPAKRRGRKTMSAEERLEVSQRMRKYWENRRVGVSQAGSVTGRGAPASGMHAPATVA